MSCLQCIAIFEAVGWFGFTFRKLRCGWIVEEFMLELTRGRGVLAGSWFQRMAIHNKWKRYETMDSYVQAAINCAWVGDRGRIDRSAFMTGYSKRVITFDELAKAKGAGAWTTQAELDDDDANESWHLDNAMFDIRSPYYADDRDDGMFHQAAQRLFLPRIYARMKAAYGKIDVAASRRKMKEPRVAAAIEAERLAARKQLDLKTVHRAKRAWNIRFLKEQIGFGGTWFQRTGVTKRLV